MVYSRRLALLFFLFCSIAIPGIAQTTEASLRLNDLIAELVKANPDVQAAYLRYQAALTRPEREGALPDPRITFGWTSSGSIVPGDGLGEDPNANIGLQISQEFPCPGKRGLKA